MIRKAGKAAWTAVASAALIAAGVGIASAAKLPVTGDVICDLTSGYVKISPGLKATSPGTVVGKDYVTTVKFQGNLTNCTDNSNNSKSYCVDGDNNVGAECDINNPCPVGSKCTATTGKGTIIAGTVKGGAKIITPVGDDIPSCGGLAGGSACNGGSNDGNACSDDSECPGGTCGSSTIIPPIVAQIKWLGNGTCKKDKNLNGTKIPCTTDIECNGPPTTNLDGDICKFKPVNKTFAIFTFGAASANANEPIKLDVHGPGSCTNPGPSGTCDKGTIKPGLLNCASNADCDNWINKGAFSVPPGTATLHLDLSSSEQSLLDACAASVKGLTELDFNGCHSCVGGDNNLQPCTSALQCPGGGSCTGPDPYVPQCHSTASAGNPNPH